jgi:hypothetical protein
MRVGKTAALALGGGIILLEIANEKGYIKINWDKVQKNLDKVTDTVEEKVSGQAPGWMDKVFLIYLVILIVQIRVIIKFRSTNLTHAQMKFRKSVNLKRFNTYGSSMKHRLFLGSLNV